MTGERIGLKTASVWPLLILCDSGGRDVHPHFPNEETKAQRGWSPSPGLHSVLAVR